MMQAIHSTRPGGSVGYVGVPRGVELNGEKLYRAKYKGSPYLSPIIAARARSATVKILPRETNG
jgi:hypothetical protein